MTRSQLLLKLGLFVVPLAMTSLACNFSLFQLFGLFNPDFAEVHKVERCINQPDILVPSDMEACLEEYSPEQRALICKQLDLEGLLSDEYCPSLDEEGHPVSGSADPASAGENAGTGPNCSGLTPAECSVVGEYQYQIEYVSFDELCAIPEPGVGTYTWEFGEGTATWTFGGTQFVLTRQSENSYVFDENNRPACEELEFYQDGFQCTSFTLQGDLCTLANYTKIQP